MWLTGRMRQAFAVAGLMIAAVLAYFALSEPAYLIAAVTVYGLTKLGVNILPWQG